MRSLTVKLTLVLAFISLIGGVLSVFFIRQRTEVEFDQFLFDQNKERLSAAFAEYYARSGSWEGVDSISMEKFIKEGIFSPPPADGNVRQGGSSHRPSLYLLTDASGIILYGDPVHSGEAAKNFRSGTEVKADGETVGYLVPSRSKMDRDSGSPEETFLNSVRLSILVSAIIALTIALLLGSVLIRALTQPLRELTAATQTLSRGELGVQVRVQSRDELGELAKSFNQMSADLARSNLARRQMTADIAHDLGTPLSVILGYTEALADGKLEGSQKMYEVMHQEAGHLKHLVEDLRLLSLADAGELPLQLRQTPVNSLLQRAADFGSARAGEMGIRVESQAADGLPDVLVDVERMAQVMGNLVSNALRYTPSGGSVRLFARLAQGGVEILVADTGSGIAAEDLPHVFNRFYRGNKSRQSNGEAGLGLAIAKSLVEAQGGKISVESYAGRGTTFIINLPGV